MHGEPLSREARCAGPRRPIPSDSVGPVHRMHPIDPLRPVCCRARSDVFILMQGAIRSPGPELRSLTPLAAVLNHVNDSGATWPGRARVVSPPGAVPWHARVRGTAHRGRTVRPERMPSVGPPMAPRRVVSRKSAFERGPARRTPPGALTRTRGRVVRWVTSIARVNGPSSEPSARRAALDPPGSDRRDETSRAGCGRVSHRHRPRRRRAAPDEPLRAGRRALA